MKILIVLTICVAITAAIPIYSTADQQNGVPTVDNALESSSIDASPIEHLHRSKRFIIITKQIDVRPLISRVLSKLTTLRQSE